MAVNRGKQFEDVVQECFEKTPNVSVDRLHDQTTGYVGSSNVCDFIVYRKPRIYYIECKSVHGNTLSIHSVPKLNKRGKLQGFYGNISDKQWEGLLEKSKIDGAIAGIMCWWIDHDVTLFIPIGLLADARKFGYKSIRYDFNLSKVIMGNDLKVGKCVQPIAVSGMKKRVFFDYDMESFLQEVSK